MHVKISWNNFSEVKTGTVAGTRKKNPWQLSPVVEGYEPDAWIGGIIGCIHFAIDDHCRDETVNTWCILMPGYSLDHNLIILNLDWFRSKWEKWRENTFIYSMRYFQETTVNRVFVCFGFWVSHHPIQHDQFEPFHDTTSFSTFFLNVRKVEDLPIPPTCSQKFKVQQGKFHDGIAINIANICQLYNGGRPKPNPTGASILFSISIFGK